MLFNRQSKQIWKFRLYCLCSGARSVQSAASVIADVSKTTRVAAVRH